MHFDAKDLRQGGEARTLFPFSPSPSRTHRVIKLGPLPQKARVLLEGEASKPGVPGELQVYVPQCFSVVQTYQRWPEIYLNAF